MVLHFRATAIPLFEGGTLTGAIYVLRPEKEA